MRISSLFVDFRLTYVSVFQGSSPGSQHELAICVTIFISDVFSHGGKFFEIYLQGDGKKTNKKKQQNKTVLWGQANNLSCFLLLLI